MAKKRKPRNRENMQASDKKSSIQFRFDDPVPVMDGNDLLQYMETWINGDYYEPHLSLQGLRKTFKASASHGSAIWWKVNRLTSSLDPKSKISKPEFKRNALDYLLYGNGYVEQIKNTLGSPLSYRTSPALKTRRMVNFDQYCFLKNWSERHEFDEGAIFHLIEPDSGQEVYGEPQYLCGLQSVWLGESATLFRRKYYRNGSHAGYIMYITDPVHNENDIKALEKAMAESKGPGNFRNLLLYAPKGQKDGLQVMPLAEATAKDEFFNISRATSSDILVAHRVPPVLLGKTPENVGGFGDAKTADEVTYLNEIVPIQEYMLEINEFFGEEVVKFKPYQPLVSASD